MASALSDDLVQFVQTHLGSSWALELLVTLMRQPGRIWTVPELVGELRASDELILALVDKFQRTGLLTRTDGGAYQWHPASAALDDLCHRTLKAHGVTPFAVQRAISEAPSQRVIDFANAFRLRKD